MTTIYLRKYGEATAITFSLRDVDGASLKTDAVHGTDDTQISKDEGAEAEPDSAFVDEGRTYSQAFTATEMQAARIMYTAEDQTSPPAYMAFDAIIETFGHASAQIAVDLDDIVRAGLTALPNAAADAAGGLPISDAGGLDMDAMDGTIADIETDTQDIQTQIGTAGAGLTDLGGMSTAMKAEVNAEADQALADYDGPTNAEMEARTLVAASYFDPAADTVATVTDVTNQVSADVTAISGDATAADNLESQYDTTGLTGDTFPATQAQVGNIATGAGGLSALITDFAKVGAEPETNTYLATQEGDGVYHIVEDDGGSMDFYYEATVTAGGKASSFKWLGYVQSQGDSVDVYYWDWSSSTYKQISSLSGFAGTTALERGFDVPIGATGTGADEGKARLRFLSSDATAVATDRLLCEFSQASTTVGYANGAIWIDTNVSNTNTVDFVDGTADNPVSTLAAALTLSASVGINRLQIAPNSVITLASDMTGYVFRGEKWTLNTGGQNMTNCYVWGALVSGTITGTSNPVFDHCRIDSISTIPITAFNTGLSGTITATGTGDFNIDNCFSMVAGAGTPVLDFGAAVGSLNVNFRHYSGGIEIQNMGQSGADKMSLEGDGQFVLNANCVGGDFHVRGSFQKTDNTAGLVSIVEVANIKTNVITDGYARASTANTIQLATAASSTDGAYDPSEIFIVAGTGAGQTRLIYQYAGATRIAVIDRNWKTNPDATSEYRIVSHPGREHVNEGLAQAGSTPTTIKLNALASTDNDAYKGQLVFIRSGTGEDQVGLVGSYVGATQTVTLANGDTWAVTPDGTSGYAMLPAHTFSSTQIQAINEAALAAYTAPTLAQLESEINDVQSDIAALNDISTSDVDTALSDIYLDQLFAANYDPASKPGVGTALLNELVEDDGGVARYTANALEEAPTGGSAPTVEEIRTEMDDNSTQLAAIVADTNELQSDDIPGLIAALNDLSAAQVNAEMVDVLATDTYAEPGQGAPAATASIERKLAYVYKFLRNKIVQNATTLEVYNDAGAVVDQKSTVSDDGTSYTRGQIESGP